MDQLMEKDVETYEHSMRVASLAKAMAVGMGLDKKRKHQLVTGCFLHDIGKLRIPIEVLNKTTSLLPHEWDLMRLHPSIGAHILREYANLDMEIINIVEFHHERWNGQGYPNGLSGHAIPEFARICAVLDAYDCMISDRPYRSKLTVAEAITQLLLHAGEQFDEKYVHILIQLLKGNITEKCLAKMNPEKIVGGNR
ncbi:HD-GYP domain-containing protein [Paenibacillus agricola]|uniref:HD domain-containing protein n=1 Tax=Paenibacillus agricola TaxID=2716264 RepID=A0ABX0J6U7_9BACL|nr:HD domain-containing phosphohydrolase [Paenibacillus agricola]NHN29756.1 HD domain-containing protein [Paenibacillus agricola]